MLIDQDKLLHWIGHFYGYGSWQARLWFIPNNEDGGELPEAVASKINFFHDLYPEKANTVCNIRRLYQHLPLFDEGPKKSNFPNRYEYRFGDRAILHGVWKNLIAFARGYGVTNALDELSYQKTHFLDHSRQTEAIIPLYPLPGPRSHAWYYSWLHAPALPFLKSQQDYEEHVYEARMHTILSNIETYKPAVVLMYGMENVTRIKKSIQHYFGDTSFNLIKATKQQIPQHHRLNIGETTIIVTTQIPALRHRRVESGFEWEEFGRRVTEARL